MPRVAAIVLAAGASTRMGRPKQLLPVDGVPMVLRAVEAARAAGCDPVVVVLGRDAEACRGVLQSAGPAMAVDNPDWERGMGTSLRCGAQAIPDDTSACFILLADQPRVTAATLRRLAAAACPERPVAVADFDDTVGPPVRVDRATLLRLRNWPQDAGAKALWLAQADQVARVPCPEASLDVDTPADYAALPARTGKERA